MIESMTFRTKPRRRKPKAGDRKTVAGVEYVRRQVVYRDARGKVIGSAVNNGQPVYEWVRA